MNNDRVLDVVVMHKVNLGNPTSGRVPINSRIDINKDVYIDVLPNEIIKNIFNACEPKGYNYSLSPLCGKTYVFARKDPPSRDWDNDQRLQLCLALSRLIQPTSISTEYSATVYLNSSGMVNMIAPGLVSGMISEAYVVDEESDYLTEYDALDLQQLIKFYEVKPLEGSLARAMWYHEYAARAYEIDIRWPLIATGIEAIIHTDRDISTRQFTERVYKLASEVGIDGITKNVASDMYEYRSSLSHGQGIRGLTDKKREVYKKMEDLLRLTLQKSIKERSFRDFISNPEEIRKKWPV